MKNAVHWAKSNPWAVLAGLISLAAVAIIVAVTFMGAGFEESLEDHASVTRRIDRLSRQTVSWPGENPDDPPQTLTAVLNAESNRRKRELYRRMETEYKGMFELTREQNEPGHLPMLEGLFPTPATVAIPHDAKRAYRSAFQEMLSRPTANPLYPRLNAGPAPDLSRLQTVLEQIQQDFLTSGFEVRTVGDLTPKERERLAKLKQNRLLDELKRYAQSINIYAQTDIDASGFPFDVGAWSNPASGRPEIEELWEGQMNLWIQQDIVKAISEANNVGEEAADVTTAPVKRLISIDVVEGYVGIDNKGAIKSGSGSSLKTAGMTEEELAQQEVPDDFSISHTGRRSNYLYDVRHAVLTVDVDSRRVPELINALSRSNFMTVLMMKIEDVDEYEMLKQGYMYGRTDVVQATLTIETIWMRSWTTELMPQEIRYRLGVDKRPEDEEDDN